DNTFYGFTCFRRRWSFFFNHSPPDGGHCEDPEGCEDAVQHVTVGLVIEGLGEHQANFELTENTYYAEDDFSPEGLAAIAAAPATTLKLDPRRAEAWGIDELSLPMDGLAPVLEQAAGRCMLVRDVRRRRVGPRRGSRRDRR